MISPSSDVGFVKYYEFDNKLPGGIGVPLKGSRAALSKAQAVKVVEARSGGVWIVEKSRKPGKEGTH